MRLGERLDALVAASHYAAVNGEPHAENELEEIENAIRKAEKKVY